MTSSSVLDPRTVTGYLVTAQSCRRMESLNCFTVPYSLLKFAVPGRMPRHGNALMRTVKCEQVERGYL